MCVIAYWSHYTSFSIIALHITAKMETFKAGLKYIVNRKDGGFFCNCYANPFSLMLLGVPGCCSLYDRITLGSITCH